MQKIVRQVEIKFGAISVLKRLCLYYNFVFSQRIIC